MITILTRHVTRKIWVAYLEGQGHSMTLQQNRVKPLTSIFIIINTTNLFCDKVPIHHPSSTVSCFSMFDCFVDLILCK